MGGGVEIEIISDLLNLHLVTLFLGCCFFLTKLVL